MSAIAARLARAFPQTNARLGITVRPLLDKVVVGNARHAARADGDGDFRAADCLRERREYTAGARLGPAAGDRLRDRDRRQPRACHAAAADREPAARGGGRDRRPGCWPPGAFSGCSALLPPGSLPRQQDVGLDCPRLPDGRASRRSSLGCATGLAPALQLRRGLHRSAQDGAKGATEGGQRSASGALLVAGEVTLALVLLVGAD